MLFSASPVRNITLRAAFKLCGLTWSGQELWFSEAVTNQVMSLDPLSGEVTRGFACPGVRADLTTVGGYLLQVCGPSADVRVLDPDTGVVVSELGNPREGHRLCGLEATHDGIFMGFEDLGVVDLRETRSFRLIESFEVTDPAGLTVSDRYLFTADHRGSLIRVYDRRDHGEVASIDIDGSPTGITWDGSRIWYCDYATLQLRAIEVPGLLRADVPGPTDAADGGDDR